MTKELRTIKLYVYDVKNAFVNATHFSIIFILKFVSCPFKFFDICRVTIDSEHEPQSS